MLTDPGEIQEMLDEMRRDEEPPVPCDYCDDLRRAACQDEGPPPLMCLECGHRGWTDDGQGPRPRCPVCTSAAVVCDPNRRGG